MASKQRTVAEDFSLTFPDKTVEQWRKMVKDWQANPSLTDPYVSNERSTFFLNYLVAVPYGYSSSIKTL